MIIIMATAMLSPAIAEVPISIQHKLMDLSGLSPIVNIPKLETTDQRNQFFDNYSVLSMPDFKAVDQIQLQGIQTFSPSHRKVSLEVLNKIKDITSGLSAQDIAVTPEDLKGIKIQDGKITIPDMANKGQQVKDIVSAANAVMQEVKSLNQKDLGSLKLTITDIKNIQSVVPMIQQQLSRTMLKGTEVNSVSVDVAAMNVDMANMGQEVSALFPNLTFADFNQFVDMKTSPSGAPIMPNYDKETASDNLNRFVEIMNKTSEYIEAGAILPSISAVLHDTVAFAPHTVAAFQMKGVDTITGSVNGFMNVAPAMGSVATGFRDTSLSSEPVLTFTQPAFNWSNQNSGALLQTVNSVSGFSATNLNQVNLVNSNLTGAQMLSHGFQPYYNTNLAAITTPTTTSAFDYMPNATFATFADFDPMAIGLEISDSVRRHNALNQNSLLSITLQDAMDGFCTTGSACRDKLSIGDLVGSMDELTKSIPEGVIIQ